MCCKIFKFQYKDGSVIYINASDSSKCKPEIVLNSYLFWYNGDFAPSEDLPLRDNKDFTFIESFWPIDFYDETVEIVRSL